MIGNHHNLISYQKAKNLTLEIISLSDKLPKNRTHDILFSQILRSASSIGANIIEGYGRNNPKEYKQFLGIARGSCLETEYWLDILQNSSVQNLQNLIGLNTEIIKIITATISNIKTREG